MDGEEDDYCNVSVDDVSTSGVLLVCTFIVHYVCCSFSCYREIAPTLASRIRTHGVCTAWVLKFTGVITLETVVSDETQT